MLEALFTLSQAHVAQVPPALARNPSAPPLQSDLITNLIPVDLEHVATLALKTNATKALWTGSIILAVGWSVRMLCELVKGLQKEDTAYLKQCLICFTIAAVFCAYGPITLGIIRTVSHMGPQPPNTSMSQLDHSYAQRKLAYEKHVIELHPKNMLDSLSPEALKLVGLGFVVDFLHVVVSALMVILQTLQVFALAAFLFFGPIVIGVAALGEFFQPLAIGWFWGVVEVSAWSITSDVMLAIYTLTTNPKTSYSAGEEIGVSLSLLAVMIAVPVFTSMIIRGSPGAALMQSAMFVTATSMAGGKMAGSAGLSAIGKVMPGGRMAKLAGGVAKLAGAGVGRGGGWLNDKAAARSGSGGSAGRSNSTGAQSGGNASMSEAATEAVKRYMGNRGK